MNFSEWKLICERSIGGAIIWSKKNNSKNIKSENEKAGAGPGWFGGEEFEAVIMAVLENEGISFATLSCENKVGEEEQKQGEKWLLKW